MSTSYYVKLGKTITGPIPEKQLPLLWNEGKLPEHAAVSTDKVNWTNIQAHLGVTKGASDEEPVLVLGEVSLDNGTGFTPSERKKKARIKDKDVDEVPTGVPSLLKQISFFLLIISWAGVLMVVLGAGPIYLYSVSKSVNYIQECAISAATCTVLIGFYVFVRCLEKITTLLDRGAGWSDWESEKV